MLIGRMTILVFWNNKQRRKTKKKNDPKMLQRGYVDGISLILSSFINVWRNFQAEKKALEEKEQQELAKISKAKVAKGFILSFLYFVLT